MNMNMTLAKDNDTKENEAQEMNQDATIAKMTLVQMEGAEFIVRYLMSSPRFRGQTLELLEDINSEIRDQMNILQRKETGKPYWKSK
jgi:hypothetical protein